MQAWIQIALTILGAALVAALTSIRVAWILRGWLEKRFADLKKSSDEKFAELQKHINDALQKHEDKDSERHLENLSRFSDIAVTFAQSGLRLVKGAGSKQ